MNIQTYLITPQPVLSMFINVSRLTVSKSKIQNATKISDFSKLYSIFVQKYCTQCLDNTILAKFLNF